MSLRLFSWALSATVGLVFAVAGWVKLADPQAFLSSLLTYQLFPYKLAVALALFAPILELLVAACLVTGILRKGGRLLAAVLLVVFIALVAQGWTRGLVLDCGCFGSNSLSGTADYVLKIGQNGLLLAAVLLAGFFESRSKAEAT